jgi:hypothetical protein
MTINNANVGASYVPAYQISGVPYVTASVVTSGTVTQIDFPYVTNFLALKNTAASGTLIAGFTRNGVLGTNNFTLGTSGSFGADLRIKSFFLTANTGSVTFELLAGLTLINVREFPILTGSGVPTTGSFGYNGLG